MSIPIFVLLGGVDGEDVGIAADEIAYFCRQTAYDPDDTEFTNAEDYPRTVIVLRSQEIDLYVHETPVEIARRISGATR